ncbi:hypothetical protein PV327_006822 [Microctonus hyperodae]|uniref:Uncharacterized protein n=1 Tax=Microctonus hyperodae TaxID=165561 RepID=A0AA39F591_MICHY|nr:hypothetical protein PV327_006822 [Microctonus hyperodae]
MLHLLSPESLTGNNLPSYIDFYRECTRRQHFARSDSTHEPTTFKELDKIGSTTTSPAGTHQDPLGDVA